MIQRVYGATSERWNGAGWRQRSCLDRLGALITSRPLVAKLSMVWLWRDTGVAVRLAAYAEATFWFALPNLAMFLLIPMMLRAGVSFWISLCVGPIVTAILRLLTRATLARYGFVLWRLQIQIRTLPGFGYCLNSQLSV